MAAKTIAVIGATGLQGGSVVTALLADGGFKVRALTRDVDKAAQLKAKGVEVVVADGVCLFCGTKREIIVCIAVDNTDTLRAAFKGVHGVFAMTSTGPSDEAAQGKNIADAAKAEGIAHLVWRYTNLFNFIFTLRLLRQHPRERLQALGRQVHQSPVCFTYPVRDLNK